MPYDFGWEPETAAIGSEQGEIHSEILYLLCSGIYYIRTLRIDVFEGLPYDLVQDVDDGEYHAGWTESPEPDT